MKYFWIVRELIGWLFIAAGLWVFLLALDFVIAGKSVSGGICTGIGFCIFRGGLHLVKVASAAGVLLRKEKATSQ